MRGQQDESAPAPTTWFLHGDKSGDNGQVETILARLGWPVTRKFLAMRPEYVWGKPRFKATLSHLDRERSDPLNAPWPDLIITVGRRPSMAALWVRKHSGGRTRIVLLGKPTGKMHQFDLVIASAENQLPPLANYLPITLPLMRVDRAAVDAAAAAWRSRLDALPRPLIGILVGGATNPFVMNEAAADRLIAEARRIVAVLGGTPYVTTSRRTPARVTARLRDGLPPQARFFAWEAGSEENPYKALLGAADGFIVTGDSISMMVEVMHLGKPLQIFPLPISALARLDQFRRGFAHWLFNPRKQTRIDRVRHAVGPLVYWLDIFKLLCSTRDFRAFHRMLVERGLARWVGGAMPPTSAAVPDELDLVVTKIRAIAHM